MESIRSALFVQSAVLLWILVLVQADAQSRIEEVQVLTTFRKQMEAANGATFGVLVLGYWFSWNENDQNACAWVGVTCSTSSTVVALDLSNWGLQYLTNLVALSKLPDLRQLDMSSNSLVGFINFGTRTNISFPADITYSFPDDIGNFTQLIRLDFSGNFFSGKIPLSISKCRSLQYLSLERNYFSGAIPDLRGLVHLQFLLLADNYLEFSFPRGLGELSSLLSIDVSSNQLSGRILVNTTKLRNLWLDNNFFIGFEEPMNLNAPNLQQLFVGGNQLEGMIPAAIANLSNLITLDMSNNSLSGKIPSGLWSNAMMSTVDLSQNQLSGSIPADLLSMPPYLISKFQIGQFINLSSNRLSGNIPTFSLNRTDQDLEVDYELDLSYNQLTGSCPSQMNSTGVVVPYFNLGNNLLTGDIVDVLLAGIGFPVYFFLVRNNHLTGDLTRMTFQWANSSLDTIDLSNNDLSWTASESIPDPLGAALNGNKFREFRVAGNNFAGTSLPFTPPDGLIGLEVLDLSNNQLEGVISGHVFNGLRMPSLQILNLSSNSAIGPVPGNITTLPSLTSLDLSDNKLSGPLPSIPLNSSLFNPSIFLGNDGLCGYPLPQCAVTLHGTAVQWWIFLISIGGSMTIAIGSCLILTWRWRVYHKRHEQDADLIRTLMDRKLVTLMPLRHLKKATDNFAHSAKIGEGGFGTVYMGKLNDGTVVAIKRNKQEGSEKDKVQFLNEVRILSQVSHRHLVKLMGCCMENRIALLVFEFVSNGTLQEHLQRKIGDGHLSWKQRLDIAVQTADALNYLHSATMSPIYHRDVKSANILLNEDLSAKVADFGISKLAPMNATHVSTAIQGTMGYIDPEYWVSFQLTEKSDVYSFGVVLLELISAKLVVDLQRGGEETSLVVFASQHIAAGNLEPLMDPSLMETYSEQSGHGKESMLDLGRLAMRCVNIHSKFRPSMKEVWKELQDMSLKFNGTFMKADFDSGNIDDYGNSRLDEEVLFAHFTSSNDNFRRHQTPMTEYVATLTTMSRTFPQSYSRNRCAMVDLVHRHWWINDNSNSKLYDSYIALESMSQKA